MKTTTIKSGLYAGFTYESIDAMRASDAPRNEKTHKSLEAYNNAEVDFAYGLISAEELERARIGFEGL